MCENRTKTINWCALLLPSNTKYKTSWEQIWIFLAYFEDSMQDMAFTFQSPSSKVSFSNFLPLRRNMMI